MTLMILPDSSRSTLASVGLTAVGRAVVMASVDAVEEGGREVEERVRCSVPPVGALRREARPRRL